MSGTIGTMEALGLFVLATIIAAILQEAVKRLWQRHKPAERPLPAGLRPDRRIAALTDIDGSGTPDLLWGHGHEYRFIDLTGGVVPHLLARNAAKRLDLIHSAGRPS